MCADGENEVEHPVVLPIRTIPDGRRWIDQAAPRGVRELAQQLAFTGTFGSLSVPTMRLRTYARAEDRSWWKPFEESVVGLARTDPLAGQLEHFGAVVRGETAPIVSARDGLQNLRVTEAIAEAARTGRLVNVASPAPA